MNNGNSDTDARVEVSLRQVAECAPPIGVNNFGDMGGTHFSEGNLIPDSGFEPVSIRRYWRVSAAGTEEGLPPWVELDAGGMTEWDLVTTGFLNGATYRHYRLVDAAGNPLPQRERDGYIDMDLADRYVLVGTGTVPLAGAPGLPLGGWVDTVYAAPGKVWGTRTNLDFTDAQWVENGRRYYYIVTAIGSNTAEPAGTNESDPGTAIEVYATPQIGLGNGPQIYVPSGDGFAEIGRVTSGAWYAFRPAVAGAAGTITWTLLDANGEPVAVAPAGLSFDEESGELSGVATSTPPPTGLRWRVTAGNGTATRDFILNNTAWTTTGGTTRPEPPTNVTAMPGDGFVHLAWSASPTPGVVGYRVYRAEVPRAQQRRRVYLDPSQPAAVKDDYLYFSLRGTQFEPMTSHPRVRDGRIRETWRHGRDFPNTILRRVPHPDTVRAAMPFLGETCMEMQTPYRGVQEIGGPYIFYPNNGGVESEWYSQLEPGRTYRFEAWIRQSGLDNDGRVELGFNSFYSPIRHQFTVDGEWRLYGFEFPAPERHTGSDWHSSSVLRFTGPGTLWFDNIRLFRFDSPEQIGAVFAPSPLVFDVLMASQPPTGEKGMLRSMQVLLNASSMAGNLSYHRDASLTMGSSQRIDAPSNMTVPFFLEYARRTGESPETRMKPWLNVSSFVSEEEWLMLIEYLAAPLDPSDPEDVESKRWAYLRYKQRSEMQAREVATPWTDEFLFIRIEFANETWHNRRVENQWTGWGPAFGVHQGAREFGLAARYITDYVRDNSPYWSAAHRSGKLVWVMGSNYSDYGEVARLTAPLVGGIGHTSYVGPLWEEGEDPLGTYDDHGIRATLLGFLDNSEPRFRNYRRYREQLAAQGHLYQILGYEGGPSGYALPDKDESPDAVENAERYGKSLAMAVAALDAWLGANQYGFTDQGYLSFGQGSRWSSHSTIPHGFNPHVPWLGLVMRNRHATGPMIQAEVVQTPTILWDGEEKPLVGAYAFRSGSRLAVFLLSRKLGGMHNDVDFENGSTPVTLILPAEPVGRAKAKLYSLEGDPRTTNRTALTIDIQESPATLARETSITLPQGAVYLYVVDTGLPDRDDPPAQPDSPELTYTSAGTTLIWPAVAGATGYAIYRSRTPYFEHPQESAEFTSETPSFTDEGGVGGTTFYYRVAGVNGWGTGYPSLVAVGGTNPNEPPLPAPELDALAEADGVLLVSWGAVPGADGYRVGHGRTSGGPYRWTDVDGRKHFLTGLINGTSHYVTVYAYGAAGRSPEAKERTGVPVAAGQEVVLAGWDAADLVYSGDTPDDATSLPASRRQLALEASALTRGSGLRTETITHGFKKGEYNGSFPIIPVADNGNFGTHPVGSLDNAISRDLYLTVKLTPERGQSISLSSFEGGLFYRFSESILNVALRYQAGTANWITVDVPPPAITAGTFTPTEFAIPLSGEVALQDLTEAVELRLYVYHAGPDARYHPAAVKRTTTEDMLVRGSYASLGARVP